jgi:hypothetical protein
MNPLLQAKRNGVSTEPAHEYAFKVFNGRVKVYIDGYIAFCFNQIDFKGFYSYKDDTSLYGLDLYLMNENGGATTIPVYFKTKEVWLSVLQLLDRNM